MTKVYKRNNARKSASKPVIIPEAVDVRKAKNLPMFGPGIVISVPLALWPAYRELYHLDKLSRSTRYDVDLFVKRTPNAGKEGNNHE